MSKKRGATSVNPKDRDRSKTKGSKNRHTTARPKQGSKENSARKTHRGNTSNQNPPVEQEEPSTIEMATEQKYKMDDPIAMQQAENWAQRALRKGVQGLTEDFLQLKHYMPPDVSTIAYQANADKNRYPDVWCEDKSRVVLRWPTTRTNDYIHANYVATPNFKKRFICTQGPLTNTVTDFWHMIIQEHCEIILMLCNTEEKGVPKCAAYWPAQEGQKLSFDRIEIKNTKIEQPPPGTEEPSLRRTTLEIRYKQGGKHQTRKIRHFHWTDWPDRGVPKTSLTAMVLLSCVRGSKRPIAIHCAAGIGRTGSITSIEYIIEHFTDGESCEDMIEIVKKLRRQRLSSIQNNLQYLYVHRVLLMYFIDKYHVVGQTEEMQRLYEQFKREYDQLPGVNQ